MSRQQRRSAVREQKLPDASVVLLDLHTRSFGMHSIYTVCRLNYPIYAVQRLFVAETWAL